MTNAVRRLKATRSKATADASTFVVTKKPLTMWQAALIRCLKTEAAFELKMRRISSDENEIVLIAGVSPVIGPASIYLMRRHEVSLTIEGRNGHEVYLTFKKMIPEQAGQGAN